MKPFEESDRLDLPLNSESVVLDIGAHEGWFTGELWNKFGCYIYAFEPVEEFREKMERKFSGNRKVVVFPYALGATDAFVTFGVKGDLTGEFCNEPNSHQKVQVVDILRAINLLGLDAVDLATINCESGEYPIMERLIETGAIKKIRNVSVQFHNVIPDAERRMDAIIERLKETHDHVYGSRFIWDGFKLRA